MAGDGLASPLVDRGPCFKMTPGTRSLLTELRRLHHGAATGVVHLYTEKNEYGRLSLKAGEFTHVSLHTQRGPSALALLAMAAIRSHRFESSAQLPPTEGLPPGRALLSALGADALPAPAAPAPGSAQAAAVATAASSAPASAVSDAAAALIEMELSQELGPMAASLVKECRPKASSALHLAEQLAEQLMPREGEQFLARISELLRSLKAQ